VHPLERLRYVARNPLAPTKPLIAESAAVLASLSHDPAGLLTSCRNLLRRRGHCGPLVWMAARMVASTDCHDEVLEIAKAIDCDTADWKLDDAMATLSDDFTTLKVVAVGHICAIKTNLYIIPDWPCTGPENPGRAAEADVVVVASDCAGPHEALVPVEALPVVETARESGTPVWLFTGAGRMLPQAMWAPLKQRLIPDDLAEMDLVVLNLDRYVNGVVTPTGLFTAKEAGEQSDCPIVVELFA